MTNTTDTPAELLPCPFCGSEMSDNEGLVGHPIEGPSDCPLAYNAFHIDEWNTRATPPVARKWFPHLDYAGEPMREGEFRDPYPMPEELAAATPPVEMVERVARAIAPNVLFHFDACTVEQARRWCDTFPSDNDKAALRLIAAAALAAASLPDDRLRVAREALEAADKRLCELTPSFAPDVGPDVRDAEEIEKTGAVVMQIRDCIATLGEPAQSGETK